MPIYLKFTRNGQQVFKGESKAKGHEGWIELNSVQWGERRFAPKVNPEARSLPPSITDVIVTKESDSTSSALFRETLSPPAAGLTVQIDFVKEGADPKVGYLGFVMENVVISSFSVSGGQGRDKTPLEQLTLNFASITATRHSDNKPP